MSSKILTGVVGTVVALAALSVGPVRADKVTIINNYGPTPFVVGGYSYIPLRSATDFLGAALLWDSLKNRATITFNGRDVGLVVGSPYVWVGGQRVAMPVAPVMIGGQVCVPSAVFVQHLRVPVVYDYHARVIRIQKGPGAWGTLRAGPVPRGFRKTAWKRGEWERARPSGARWKARGEEHSKARRNERGKGRGEEHGKGNDKGRGKDHGKGRGGHH